MLSDLNVYLSLYTLFGSQISCLQTFMLINLKSQNGSSKEQSNNQIIIKQNEHIKKQQPQLHLAVITLVISVKQRKRKNDKRKDGQEALEE